MRFYDLTIAITGDVQSRRVYGTDALVPEAVAAFAAMLDAGGDAFRAPITAGGGRFAHIELQWTTERPGAALATFWAGRAPVTSSALVAGVDAAADDDALAALQSMIVARVGGTPVEPGFAVRAVAERPLLASVVWGTGRPADVAVIADMETCLAAAWFLRRPPIEGDASLG